MRSLAWYEWLGLAVGGIAAVYFTVPWDLVSHWWGALLFLAFPVFIFVMSFGYRRDDY